MKLIISLFISTLILSGCTFGQGKIGGSTGDDIWQKTETLSIEEDLAITSKKIKDEPEFQNCIKQQINVCRQSAGIQIAQKLKDPIFCKELSSIEQQSSCEFAVTMINVQEKNDITLCDTLTNETYKEQCKTQVYKQNAISKNDITFCDKINSNIQKSNSGWIIQQESIQKDQCIMQFVINIPSAKDIDCERILDESTYWMCKLMIKEKQKWIKSTQNSTSIQK